MKDFTTRFAVKPGRRFRLDSVDPDATPGVDGKDVAREKLAGIQDELAGLQERLYAGAQHAVLIVLQAMDTGGKDGLIRHVFSALNPQGITVTNFKAPTAEELSHDYLWRVHKAVPPRGMIGIFNRSHYEDVLIARVRGLAPRGELDRRYKQINDFEQYLSENRVTVLKFFLHIDKAEQKRRLESRLENPDKRWKFNPADLKERARWNVYMRAYDRMLNECSKERAPWFVIPSNAKWFRDLAVASIIRDTIKSLRPQFPKPAFDAASIRIDG